MKLTERKVKSLSASDRDLIVWSDDLPGFGVRVKLSGHKTYVVQYRNGAISRRLTIGTTKVYRLEEAEKRARRILVDAKDGGDPAAERDEARKAKTVADLAERYMAVHAEKKKKPRSRASDASNLRLHVLPALRRKKVAEVTREHISQLHHAMQETPGAANRVLALLSKMLNLAEKWGWRPDGSNPCRHIERYPERKMERYLSIEELQRLGAVLAEAERTDTVSAPAIAAIRLLVFTGARVSEILTARWSQVDFKRDCLKLPDSKTGKKEIYLNAPALDVLAAIKRRPKNPYLIVGTGKGHFQNLTPSWMKIRKQAGLDNQEGLEDVRLHDLRHSFASVGVAGGLSLPIIGGLLGHMSPATTARYAHLADDPLKQATALIGRRIAAAMRDDYDDGGGDVVELKQG